MPDVSAWQRERLFMCGIAGFKKDSQLSDKAQMRAMLDALHHRGPDDAGIWSDEAQGVTLGQRRLAIIDVAGGKQPISNETGKIKTVFNGEIYNFREIKAQLISLGYKFKTESDTEVVIKAFSKWKTDSFNKFVGMWSIAIWDDKLKKLYLLLMILYLIN